MDPTMVDNKKKKKKKKILWSVSQECIQRPISVTFEIYNF